MTISREQGQAIATLMSALRPEWDQPGCLAAVGQLISRDPANVAMAAVRLCATPEARTPGALTNPHGGHWTERVTVSPVRYPPKRGEDCRKHPGEWPDTCRGCAADDLTGDDSTFNPRREGAGVRAEHVRAALLEARTHNCPCGVARVACAEHRNQTEAEESK